MERTADSQDVEFSAPIRLHSMHGVMSVRHVNTRAMSGVVIQYGTLDSDPVLVRVQSSCVFSEALGSVDCDCGDQLKESLALAASEGGLVVYVYEEGRGAGLATKIASIALQQARGVDTASAFRELGLPVDPRSHAFAASALVALLGGRPVRLLSNNPSKVDALRDHGVNVVERRSLVVVASERVRSYLVEKAAVLGHDI